MEVTFAGYAMAVLLWAALIAFAVLGGADFGAGIWDIFARGPDGERLRQATVRAIGPIWEANGIWIVYFITGLWTVFPLVFAALTTALFIPLAAALLGIVMRGASFAYYTHFRGAVRAGGRWGRVFSIASTFTPFLLGAGLAAVAGGDIHVSGGQVQADYFAPWLTPFALSCGAFAVALCAVLAATYLTVEGRDARDERLVAAFRSRALIAGAITSVIGLIAGLLARAQAPHIWAGLTGTAAPLALGAMLAGGVTAAALWLGSFRVARGAVAAMVALILVAWAAAQWPLLVPPDLTIENAVAAPSVQRATLIASAIGMPIILVSLWYLFHVFKGSHMQPKMTADQYIESLPEPTDVRADEQARQREQERAIAARNEVKGDLVKSRAETEEQRQREQKRQRLLMAAQVAAAVVLPMLATLARNAWIRRRVRAQAHQAHQARHAHS